jgi:alpha-ketoglutarate-dependent taurine dioxygenase
MASGAWIEAREVKAGAAFPKGLPLVVVGRPDELPLSQWVERNRTVLNAMLEANGAVLLRGFGAVDPQEFGHVAETASDAGRLMDYVENTSPRTSVSGNVKTSTDYPPDRRILLHNEHSYSRFFPRRLFFACAVAASEGGRTMLADCRRVLSRIDKRLVARFESRGWMYVRNFRDSFGPRWQDVFQTDSPDAVSKYCADADIECDWRGDRALSTRQIRAAVIRHPVTAEPAWFNHIAFWHVTSLEPAIREVVLSELSEDDYPNQTFYGDGSSIEPGDIEQILGAYEAEAVGISWQAGDVMIIDNILAAHGRETFAPPRRVLFAMSDATDRRSIRGVPQ